MDSVVRLKEMSNTPGITFKLDFLNVLRERAMIPAAKAAYISAILQTETKEIERFIDARVVGNQLDYRTTF